MGRGLGRWLASLAVAAGAWAAASGAQAASKCDEACLLLLAGQYMDALTANDPASVSFAANLRATENGVDTPPTAGIWKTGTGWTYRHTYVDATSGQIGAFATVREGPQALAMVAIRLKVADRRISESELLVARKGDFSLFAPDWAVEPKPLFKEIVPSGRRATRAELAKIPMRYFNAIMQGKPELLDVHPDAVRVENGYQTTSSPARPSASISEGLRRLVYMSAVRQVRVPVIDVERGLVLGIVAFDLPKMEKTIMVRGKPVEVTSGRHRLPRTILLYELFKVENGLVTGVEAVLRDAPLGGDIGWPGDATK